MVADFGCGPRGSLTWLNCARERIGIDVLAKEYLDEFGASIISSNMVYVTSNEKYIPIPDNYVDCLITINSLDHVSDLMSMCNEIKRILKPGGILLGSFNLLEPITQCEPQTLTVESLQEKLLCDFEMQSYRLARMGDKDIYINVRNGIIMKECCENSPHVLWIRATKK